MRKSVLSILIIMLFSAGLVQAEMHFTAAEQAHVRLRDPSLFRDSSHFVIHFETMNKRDYAFPLPGAKLLSGYGYRGKKHMHTGIDIKTKANDTIRAVFAGTVRLSKAYGGYGNVIVIRHPNGLESVYSHNSKNLVTVNEKVKAGQAIALVGRTGQATTEHLHFEFRVNGEHFNPNILFNLKNGTLRKTPVSFQKMKNGIVVKPYPIDAD